MIVESIVFGLTAITIASLRFAYLIDRAYRSPEHKLSAIKEKRRVLERDREEWRAMLSIKNSDQGANATRHMAEIDKELIALASEEADL